jgi:hypothetical protein
MNPHKASSVAFQTPMGLTSDEEASAVVLEALDHAGRFNPTGHSTIG